MEITIFGPGCARCAEAETRVREVAAAKGGNINVQKVSDLREMLAAGVLSTPAIAIDGVVKATGRVPGKEEIAAWIEGS
ncbi:thioredoxin family protein [uncultured Desulfovibrio sp.]|uniref:thioredoxin family protein n=1 Tax=uncultured Desulfovibrio sp. TaxID=167968 RepID=UPI0025F96981|nr:thioredoxin family protein [uncultured Desulfovibrio sp.]